MSAALRATMGVLRPLGHLASALVLGPVWLTLLIVGWATRGRTSDIPDAR